MEGLEYWTKRVSEEEMPALSQTAQKIAELADDDQSHLSSLADIILQDAAMTSHVLRLTDSAYHIPRKNRTNTVTRALVMLGFNEVRSICLSVALFDPLLKGGPHRYLAKEMARAFHAASQARNLAIQRGDTASEEVFIASLLYNLGEMVFLAFGGKKAEELIREMQKPGADKLEVEQRVLGFSLKDLTAALSEKWGLGKLLNQTVKAENPDDPRSRAVALSHAFVRAVEKGWNSKETGEITKQMAELARLPQDALEPILKKSADDAVRVAESYGAHTIAEQISLPPTPEEEKSAVEISDVEEKPHSRGEPSFEDDPLLQLEILRKISGMLEAGCSISDVIETVLDGIHRGIGMDCAIFSLLSPNRKYLRAKSVIGAADYYLMRHYKFELAPEDNTVFQQLIAEQRPIWVKAASAEVPRPKLPPKLEKLVGTNPFFLAPTIVDGQLIGLFHADRSQSGRPLSVEQFSSFKQFAMQACLALEHLGKY